MTIAYGDAKYSNLSVLCRIKDGILIIRRKIEEGEESVNSSMEWKKFRSVFGAFEHSTMSIVHRLEEASFIPDTLQDHNTE